MAAYNFQKQFVPAIESGDKTMTIRRIGKRHHAKPGGRVQLYYGMRTKVCRKIVDPDPMCLSVKPISILVRPTRILAINLDGKLIRDRNAFAVSDGFSGIEAMHAFWLNFHGVGEFEGLCIKWAPYLPESGKADSASVGDGQLLTHGRRQMVPAGPNQRPRKRNRKTDRQRENGVAGHSLLSGFARFASHRGHAGAGQTFQPAEPHAVCLPLRSENQNLQAAQERQATHGASGSDCCRCDSRLSIEPQAPIVQVAVPDTIWRPSQSPAFVQGRSGVAGQFGHDGRSFNALPHVPAHLSDASADADQRYHVGAKAFGASQHPNHDGLSGLHETGAGKLSGAAGGAR